MRKVNALEIKNAIVRLVGQANFALRPDVLISLRRAYRQEIKKQSKKILRALMDNAAYAKKENIAICQDTGMPVIFVEIGNQVMVQGDLNTTINQGIADGYRKFSLRNSIVRDPLRRGGSKFSPAIIHLDMVKGSRIKLTLLPKGFGCENKSQLKMFKPTAHFKEIKEFIIQTVKIAGPDACPPYVVGVGIGGTADYASLMAKQALLIKITKKNTRLEDDLLKQINKTGIGVMGLGGKITALAVKIKQYPTHIAGLPVAVNISCHALRSAEISL